MTKKETLKEFDEFEQELDASDIERDRELERVKSDAKTSDRKYRRLMKELEYAEERLKAALHIKDHYKPARIEVSRNSKKGEATAIWLASDWHVGEKVDPSVINHFNEYNPTIAERRAMMFFQNGLKLVEKERQAVKIDTLILWLGGDIITGYIHEELEEENYLSPSEEVLFAQKLIGGGLKMLLKEGNFKRILVPCSFGNHGRSTKKKRVSSGYKNSYEWMMYHNLAQVFEDEPRVEFYITKGYLNYVNVYGRELRFHHGDNVSYQGGVGGVTIPLNKFIARTNNQITATHDFIGHFHQLTQHATFTINGSLIGFNAYAQSIGASPERPQQAFRLFDSRRGFTVSAPILVNE